MFSLYFPLDDHTGGGVDLELVLVSVVKGFPFILQDSVFSVQLYLHYFGVSAPYLGGYDALDFIYRNDL